MKKALMTFVSVMVVISTIVFMDTFAGACGDERPDHFIQKGSCLYDEAGIFYGCIPQPKGVFNYQIMNFEANGSVYGGPPSCIDGYKVTFTGYTYQKVTRSRLIGLDNEIDPLDKPFNQFTVRGYAVDSSGKKYWGEPSAPVFYKK